MENWADIGIRERTCERTCEKDLWRGPMERIRKELQIRGSEERTNKEDKIRRGTDHSIVGEGETT